MGRRNNLEAQEETPQPIQINLSLGQKCNPTSVSDKTLSSSHKDKLGGGSGRERSFF